MEPALREVEQQISAFEERLASQAAALETAMEDEAAVDAALAAAHAALGAPKLANLRAQQLLAAGYLRAHYTTTGDESQEHKEGLDSGEEDGLGHVMGPDDVAALSRIAALAREFEASEESWKRVTVAVETEREEKEARIGILRHLARRTMAAVPIIAGQGAYAKRDAAQAAADRERESLAARRLQQAVQHRKDELRYLSERLSATEARIAKAEAALAGI